MDKGSMLLDLIFDNKYIPTVLMSYGVFFIASPSFLKSLYGLGVLKSLFSKGMKMVQEVAMVVSTGQELDMPFQEVKEFLQMAKILI